jgi:hypothetical protein
MTPPPLASLPTVTLPGHYGMPDALTTGRPRMERRVKEEMKDTRGEVKGEVKGHFEDEGIPGNAPSRPPLFLIPPHPVRPPSGPPPE